VRFSTRPPWWDRKERKGHLLCDQPVLAGARHDAEGILECVAFSFVHRGSYLLPSSKPARQANIARCVEVARYGTGPGGR
jgi:hypothetical protein